MLQTKLDSTLRHITEPEQTDEVRNMTSGRELEPITISDVREIAKKRLPRQAWDYYRTGADEEHTLRRNEEAFQQYEAEIALVFPDFLLTALG